MSPQLKQTASGSTYSVCTGRATSCSNTLRRQIASCVLHDFCRKSVSTIALCSCNKSQKIKSDNLCDFLRRQNSVAETKIFTKILQYTQSDLSLQRVAATSRPTCTNRVSAATCRLFHFMKMGASTFRGPGSKITSLRTSWYGKTDNANFLPTEHCNFTPLVFYPRSFAPLRENSTQELSLDIGT